MTDPQDSADKDLNRNVVRLLRESFAAVPWPTTLLVLTTLLSSARTGFYVASMGGVTQALIGQDQGAAVRWTLVFAAAAYGEYLFYPLRTHLESIILDRTIHRLQRRVLERAATAPLVAFEQGPFFSRLERATDDLGARVSAILNNLLYTAQLIVMAGSVLVPLWLINRWFVPILIIGLIPGVVAQYRTARVVHEARVKNAPGDRLMRRLGEILTDRNAGAEIRLFGNGADLVHRWTTARAARGHDVLSAERIKARAMTIGEVGVGISVVTTLAITVWLLIDGRAPLGNWVTVTIGIDWYLGMLYGLAGTARGFREESTFLGDLFAFEAEADAIITASRRARHESFSGQRSETLPVVTSAGAMTIRADSISFRYPGSDRIVVDEVSLELRPGERLAIVGENGAGKSTLVRLLTGLYLPDGGTVTQDGFDTSSEHALHLRRDIGAVFQDYVAWQLTVRENIGFGDISRLDDDVALHHAAAQAGIGGVIEELGDGLDSYLGRQFGDRDISGGQWQRIALARAFFRNSRFLVLDEPTAALDPMAEQRLFERFATLAKGRTSLMISHRLGPARFADRVIVMEGGRIREQGHHDDLVARDGLYARMFMAQAEWYNEGAMPASDVMGAPP